MTTTQETEQKSVSPPIESNWLEQVETFGPLQSNTQSGASARPLVTMVIVFYNHAAFAADAVRSALEQSYSPLELIFSDDCSTDDTLSILRNSLSSYSGNHHVKLRASRKNLGLSRHISRLVELASGSLIVGAGGDDVSAPTRVEVLAAAAERDTGAYSLHSDIWVCDKSLKRLTQLRKDTPAPVVTAERLAIGGETVAGSSHAWRRVLFDIFGPIQKGAYQEDIAIPFRASLMGHVVFVPEVLVDYRYHGAGAWSQRVFQKDSKSYRTWHTKWARNAVFLTIGFRKDLALAASRQMISPARLAELRQLVTQARFEAHAEWALYKTSTWKWLALMLQCVRQTVPARKIAKWFVMRTFLPGYLALLVRKRRDRKTEA